MLACALPDLHAPCPNFFFFFFKLFFIFTIYVIAVFVFSDSRCKNACKMSRFVLMFSSITHKTKFWSFTRKRFCVVCALNCARILVVRALDCAQFSFAPCPFPNLAGTLRWSTGTFSSETCQVSTVTLLWH